MLNSSIAIRIVYAFAILFLYGFFGNAYPQSQQARTALVLGNGSYKDAPLANPLNDARDLSETLKGLGFEVITKTNLNQAEMKRAIRDFGDRLKEKGGVGLFYYAGHGVQSKGRNYLVPVGADIQREYEIGDQSVDANLVLDVFEYAQNRLNVMILDACRNNPFASRVRSMSGGLARMDAPSGALVAFATKPESVAIDGDGANGLYTKHLISSLKTPGLTIEQVFKRVRENVEAESKGLQSPREESSLKGEDFYFLRPTANATNETIDTETLRSAARAGNPVAQRGLGMRYQAGTGGVTQNSDEAARWYQLAASQADTDAQYLLAIAYYAGLGVPRDVKKALEWGLKSANGGNALAQYTLGNAYVAGEFVTKDLVQARAWYLKSAEQKNADAQTALARLYLKGIGGDVDLKSSLNWYEQAIKNGSPHAMADLAEYLALGSPFPADHGRALDLAKRSAANSSVQALYVLGLIHTRGLGMPTDRVAGKKFLEDASNRGWYVAKEELRRIEFESLEKVGARGTGDEGEDLVRLRARAESGDPEALNSLGFMYGMGKGGLTRNDVEAVKWYRRAGELGHVVGQSNVAYMLENGLGVSKDLPQAILWYEKAGAAGYADASTSLGRIYLSGPDELRDDKKALASFTKGANANNAEAQFFLGLMTERSLGGANRESGEARKWYERSAKLGFSPSQHAFAAILIGNWNAPLPTANEGIEWLKRAAQKGNAFSAADLGLFYELGIAGVTQDYYESVRFYRLASNKENAHGFSGLARMYKEGFGGLPKDISQAAVMFKKSADLGEPGGIYGLGVAYVVGAGVEKDIPKGLDLLKQSAAKGWTLAMNNLGEVYEHGIGVQPNLVEAKRWYALAAKQGNRIGQEALARLGN